jgi:dTDP-4-amino-4,6-dideoxygalactose transaminase
MAKAAAFSFYPGKNLGACGEAGAITTNDASVARTSRLLRDHGQSEKYHHEIEGYNGRMDAIQAGLLRVKLKHLPAWTAARVEAAKRYDAMLADVAGVRPTAVASWAKPVYHLYVVHTKQRDELRKSLTDAGVGVGLHYPLPLHLQKAYAHLGYNVGDFPVSERLAKELLSLPMFPGLKAEEVQAVAARVAEFAATPVSVS